MQSLASSRSWAPALQALGSWGRGRLRLRTVAYVSTAAEPAPAADETPKPAPTIFASRAKIATTCPPWLKSPRSRCARTAEAPPPLPS